ncbi:hypothetical protein GALL_477970 [mine drainage metagenome]|uniref:Uncharacterized protein n=1 Tax=mine drainage metagenome TaxID=410659 RepID=A0A1J5PSL1_9ZZZZ
MGSRGGSRRRQIQEFGRRRRQEINRRRRRRLERQCRVVEDEHGPLDILQLVRQRRGHVVIHPCEFGRRLGRCAQMREKAARVSQVGSARIALKVRPVGIGHIGLVGPSPSDGLTPGRKEGADALRHGIAPIVRKKICVSVESVAHQGHHIGVVGAEAAHRLGTHRSCTLRRIRPQRRARSALEKLEWRFDFGGIPRHLCALRQFIDSQAHAVKHVSGRQAALADHLGERLCVRAVAIPANGRD